MLISKSKLQLIRMFSNLLFSKSKWMLCKTKEKNTPWPSPHCICNTSKSQCPSYSTWLSTREIWKQWETFSSLKCWTRWRNRYEGKSSTDEQKNYWKNGPFSCWESSSTFFDLSWECLLNIFPCSNGVKLCIEFLLIMVKFCPCQPL